MNDDLFWVLFVVGLVLFFLFILEVYVIVIISSFLASWFGFSGVLWWICAIMIFGIINGLIFSFWRL